MHKMKLTAAQRKAGVDLRDVIASLPGTRSLEKLKSSARKKRARRLAASDKRIVELKRARAIIAVATLSTWRNKFGHYDAPNYYKIATSLGLDKKDADCADEIWNGANGADEGPETEEHAMERVNDLIAMERD